MRLLPLAWRNVQRHAVEAGLSLLAVAVAAALFTSFLTLREGPPSGFLPAWRAYIGGDILWWPGEVPAPRPGVGEAFWAHLPENGETRLDLFWPQLSAGSLYLTGKPLEPLPYRKGDPLPSVPGAQAYPRLVIPVQVDGEIYNLVARSSSQMEGLPFRLLTGGTAWPPTAPELPRGTLWAFVPRSLGEAPHLTLKVPLREGDRWNWDEAKVYGLSVAGTYQLLWDEELLVFTPEGDLVTRGQPPEPVMERPSLPVRDLFIAEDLFWQVWQAVAGESPVPVYEVAWRAEDTQKSRALAEAIARKLGGTAVSLYDLRRSATLRPELVLGPSGVETRVRSSGPPHLLPPSEHLALYSLLLGALILGGQMIHLVARRQKEGAILVALGSTWGEMAWLVLLEGGLYALLGGLLGYGIMSIAIVPSLISGNPQWLRSLLAYGETGLLVLGVSWLLGWAAALFGLGVLGRRSPVEVLKQ